MKEIVHVGPYRIGKQEDVFAVVELGVCHEQNVDLAIRFVETASRVGAHAVKVEAFQADDFVMDHSIVHRYGTTSGEVEENYYQLLKRLELAYDDYSLIKKKADELGILFFSTVHNKENADLMQAMGVCAFKIASSDVTNLPLIRDLAKRGLPIFMDTGGAYLGEVERAVREFEMEDFNQLILMHNPTGYPAPPEKTDLRFLSTLQTVFDVPVGLSCHTPGFDMVVAATALGCNVVEKPITRDRNIKSPEHMFAFQEEEAELFIRKIRTVQTSLGRSRRESIDPQAYARRTRRGLYAKYDLEVGDILSASNVAFGRPLKGIPVEYADEVLGKPIRRSISAKQPIDWNDLG